MQAFKDTTGRAWELVIDMTGRKKVLALTGVDLLKLVEDAARGMGELLQDLGRLVDVLYVLCREQAHREGVSEEDFGRGFSGDVLESAAEAFVEEWVNFTPNPKVRNNLRKMFAKSRTAWAQAVSLAEEEIDAIDPASLVRALSNSSGGSPANSASTPAPSPSGSSG